MINAQNEIAQIIVIILFAVSMLISGFFWKKYLKLRKLPIYISILVGLYFSLFESIVYDLSKKIECIFVFLMIGIVFYWCVWIQCKDKEDKFL